MRKFLEIGRSFRDEEDGAAMVEYSVLIGIITVATIAAVIFVGGWVTGQWNALETNLTGEGAPPA